MVFPVAPVNTLAHTGRACVPHSRFATRTISRPPRTLPRPAGFRSLSTTPRFAAEGPLEGGLHASTTRPGGASPSYHNRTTLPSAGGKPGTKHLRAGPELFWRERGAGPQTLTGRTPPHTHPGRTHSSRKSWNSFWHFSATSSRSCWCCCAAPAPPTATARSIALAAASLPALAPPATLRAAAAPANGRPPSLRAPPSRPAFPLLTQAFSRQKRAAPQGRGRAAAAPCRTRMRLAPSPQGCGARVVSKTLSAPSVWGWNALRRRALSRPRVCGAGGCHPDGGTGTRGSELSGNGCSALIAVVHAFAICLFMIPLWSWAVGLLEAREEAEGAGSASAWRQIVLRLKGDVPAPPPAGGTRAPRALREQPGA